MQLKLSPSLLCLAFTAMISFAGISGCSSVPTAGSTGSAMKVPNPKDPFEGMNRVIYRFNTAADKVITRPIAAAYVKVTPEPVRFVVGNMLNNVYDLWIGVNNLLQGKPKAAFSDWGRVVINSTFGLAGMADIASDLGLEKHHEDFGQTLGKWGLPPGPYVVIPILGPSNFRDGLGLVPDYAADPVKKINRTGVRDKVKIVRLIDTRAGLLDIEKLANDAALDTYTLVRDGYLARRRSLVYDGDPPEEKLTEESENK